MEKHKQPWNYTACQMEDTGENEHLELMEVNMPNYVANSCPKYSILVVFCILLQYQSIFSILIFKYIICISKRHICLFGNSG